MLRKIIYEKVVHNLIICHSEWSESCPNRYWVRGGMKNLKTCNYTEIRDILDGFPSLLWRNQYDNSMFC